MNRERVNPGAASKSLSDRRGRVNLLLVVRRGYRHHMADFQWIAREIRRLAPEVRAVTCWDRRRNCWRPSLWLRPTLVVSPLSLTRMRHCRGTICQGNFLRKSEEYRLLESVGLPVPNWQLLTESQMPDLASFGPYVVVKPDIGGRGAEVKVKRKTRVRWKPPVTHFAQRRKVLDWVVQEFVYTGPWPVSYRVATLFGRPLYAWRVEADRNRRPLRGPDKFGEGGEHGGGMSICSSGGGCTFQLCNDPEILDLAAQAHTAFPSIPLLGTDILREHGTGRLYIIEVNANGAVWHFSSRTGRSIQAHARFDLARQFDGLRRAAEVLTEVARRRAA